MITKETLSVEAGIFNTLVLLSNGWSCRWEKLSYEEKRAAYYVLDWPMQPFKNDVMFWEHIQDIKHNTISNKSLSVPNT